MHEGQVLDAATQVVGQADDDGEDHGGGAHDRGADEDGLGGGLEGVAGAVVVLQEVLGPLPPGGEAEVSADLGVDVVDVLDAGECWRTGKAASEVSWKVMVKKLPMSSALKSSISPHSRGAARPGKSRAAGEKCELNTLRIFLRVQQPASSLIERSRIMLSMR